MNIRKYEWSQTNESIIIVFPLSIKINSKNVDSVIASNYVKINIPESKFFVFLDLENEIVEDSANLVIENDKLSLNLNKKEKKLWKDLLFKGKNDELKERRKIATEQYEKKVKEQNELAKSKKKEFERFVIDKSIKEDQEKRDELVNKKKETKNEAEKDLYKFIQNYDESFKTSTVKNENDKKEDNILNENAQIQNFEGIVKKNPQIESVRVKKNNLNQIFDEEINSKGIFDSNQVSVSSNDIRQSSSLKVKLTEKKIAHFAARESLSKEPPYPKSKIFNPIKDDVILNLY